MAQVAYAGQARATLALFTAVSLFGATLASATVAFDWVTVGNPGNAADPATGYGSVTNTYQISKYEVTNAQYAGFLNAADPIGANSLALYNPYMSSHPYGAYQTGGIDHISGAPDGNKYAVKAGQGNMPVTYVSWYDAARFVNWLHNGQGTGSTESGVYDMTQALPTRAALANIFIPTENEWYKAAYHQPSASGGDSDSYWLYPTRTNTEPNSDQPPGDPSIQNNVANFYRDDSLSNAYNEGLAVTGPNGWDADQNYLTDVGAYSASSSYYGTLDQGGNVHEWNETRASLFSFGVRGGYWYANSFHLQANARFSGEPDQELGGIGFRVAGIPEPACGVVLLTLAGLARRPHP